MNEELKKAYEGIEDDLELVEYEGFYNHIKEWNFIKNYITNLQKENARLKDKLKDIEKILKSNHDVEHIYCALSQYLDLFDYELDLKDYLKEN